MAGFFPSSSPSSIAVAVSGGSDSMALASLTQQWCHAHQCDLVALIVDHKLRKESTAEALLTAERLSSHGIACHILNWEGKKPQSNLQAIAREKRYALLTDWCHEHDINSLLIAHHADDQAETLLLRLLRGSGVDGLSAITAENKRNGIRILRPLLTASKHQLIQHLEERSWEWVNDPSNQNTQFDRVRARQWLESQPDHDRLISRLNQTTQHLARARDALESIAAEILTANATIHAEGYATISIAAIRQAHEEIALRMLSALLRIISGDTTPPRFESLWPLYQSIIHDHPYKGSTLHGCEVIKYSDEGIGVIRELAAISMNETVISDTTFLWDKRFRINLTSATNHPIHIAPLKQENWLNLCQNYPHYKEWMMKQNIPKKVLYGLPAFFTLEKLAAVPHIGYIANQDNLTISCVFQPSETVFDAYFSIKKK